LYLLDSNVIIESKNRYYHFDICPGFWDALKKYHRITTIDYVIKELKDGKDDEIIRWIDDENVKTILKSKIIRIDSDDIQESFGEVAEYISTLSQPQSEKDKFLSKADPWLIAASKIRGHTIVTHEKYIPDPNTKKIKIPNVAEYFGVECISLCELLKRENIQFFLKESH